MSPPGDCGLTTEEWVRKLRTQARDGQAYSHRLYEQVGLGDAERVLDVGCGTGAVTASHET
jgi:ubiquinone/menaquinone biosynthesis C-methylase UbiE